MAGRTIIQHYHTTGTTAPVASNLEYGEIAVGAGSTNTHLYIKDDTGALRTFSPAATNTITAGSGKYFTSLTQVDGKLVSGATANLPSGDGGGAYLPLSGGTVDGALTVNNNLTVTGTTTLSIGGTVYTGDVNIASGSHVFFNRADWNYISLPDSDYAALAICRGIAGGSNAQYLLSHDSFRPANDNTKTIGTSSYRWNNIYSKGADIDGNIHVKRSSTGGTIFFGDMDSDDEGYVYIREKSSDRLEIAADSGILLHTGCVNEGDDIVLRIWHPDRNGALRPDTFSSTNTNTMSIDLGTDSQRFYDGYFSNKIYAANGFYQSSDERLKTFGDDLKIDLDALSKCRKSYFTFNENTEEKHIGVSAQEIQKLYPEVVTETIEGYLNVDYAKLSVVALAAVDKLHEEVSELKELVKQLMNK